MWTLGIAVLAIALVALTVLAALTGHPTDAVVLALAGVVVLVAIFSGRRFISRWVSRHPMR
jgi:hypothetical protein